MLALAQQKLAAGDFDQVAKAIPGADKYLASAKQLLGTTNEKDPDVGYKASIIQAAFLAGWALGGGFFGRIGDQVIFYGKALGGIPHATVHFRKEIIRLIAEISMGAGTLAMIGGTEILRELASTKVPERAGRAQDHEAAYMMQKLRSLGYM